MAGQLSVDLVAADRRVWSGTAEIVVARTTEGEIGIMPGHESVLGLLVSGPVTIRTTDGGTVSAAVHGGFLSVADDQISILTEIAELAEEIDVSRAEAALETAQGDLGSSEVAEADAARRRAQTRLRVAGAR